MTENSITIIITSFRSDNKIINCLNSISRKYKIIVIENSNNFSIKKKLEDQYENVTCILAGENLGYAKGNNLGLSKVKTPYALILNPDTIVNENAIEKFFFNRRLIKLLPINPYPPVTITFFIILLGEIIIFLK